MDPATSNFWKEWATIGEELLVYGRQVGYGMSLIEVKFQAGQPAVIVRSKSVKKKYPDNHQAKAAITQLMDDAEAGAFDGARTFTLAYNRGQVRQVLLDEYGNQLLK